MLSTSNFASVHTYLGPSSSARGRTCTGGVSPPEPSQASAAHAAALAEGVPAETELAVVALGVAGRRGSCDRQVAAADAITMHRSIGTRRGVGSAREDTSPRYPNGAQSQPESLIFFR